MAPDGQNPDRDQLRTRFAGNIPDLVVQTQGAPPTDDQIIGKTWKVRRGTVRRVTAVADKRGVNYGDLVDWMLTHVLDEIDAGQLDLPIEAVSVSVSVLQGRQQRRHRPAESTPSDERTDRPAREKH